MSLSNQRLAIIGAGNMGGALLSGLIDSGVVDPKNVVVHDHLADRTEAVAEQFGVTGAKSNAEAVKDADVVLLAIKPQVLPTVLAELVDQPPDALYLSVIAGATTTAIAKGLGGNRRVVRAMPNTPALIKRGATAMAPGAHATEDDVEVARAILEAVGRVVDVEEKHLDAVTGLSGSGPAYVFVMIEAMADAAVQVGLPRDVAMTLAVQTVEGAARLTKETGEHPGRLKDMVTSPGGTTIAGLHALENAGFRAAIMNAVEAATLRSKKLGES